MAASTSALTLTPGSALTARRTPAPRRTVVARAAFGGSPLPRSPVAPKVSRKAFLARAVTEEAEGVDVEAIVDDLKAKWDATENKTSVVIYGVGAIVVLWLSSTIVGAVNNVPLLPKMLELVGLGYSAWFVYRYLLFKSSREELLEDVEELKKKITGAVEDA